MLYQYGLEVKFLLSNEDGPFSGKMNLFSIVCLVDGIYEGFYVKSFFKCDELAFVETIFPFWPIMAEISCLYGLIYLEKLFL